MGTQNRSYANRPKFSPPVTIKVLLAFLGEGFINQHHRRRFTERGTEMVDSFSQLLTKHSCGEFPHCRGFQWKGNFCFGGFCLLPTLRSGPGSGMQLGEEGPSSVKAPFKSAWLCLRGFVIIPFSENDPLLAIFEHAASDPGLQSL